MPIIISGLGLGGGSGGPMTGLDFGGVVVGGAAAAAAVCFDDGCGEALVSMSS